VSENEKETSSEACLKKGTPIGSKKNKLQKRKSPGVHTIEKGRAFLPGYYIGRWREENTTGWEKCEKRKKFAPKLD